jgi:adenylate cyclase
MKKKRLALPSRKSLLGVSPAHLTLGTILLVLILFWWGWPILDLIELKTYDIRMLWRGPRRGSPAVVLAAIDEKSLNREGRWPWPRSKLAALLDALSRDRPKVVGFDIVFAEPDQNSRLSLVEDLFGQLKARAIKDAALLRFLGDQRLAADTDLALATAIKRSSAPVVLGYFFHESQSGLQYRLEPGELERRLERIDKSKYPKVTYAKGTDPDSVGFIRQAYAPETNIDVLSSAAVSAGFFTIAQSDRDGVLRWMPLVIRAGESLFPPLSVVTAWHYLGRPELSVNVGADGLQALRIGDRVVPTDEQGRLLINYPGPEKSFLHVSVTDILNGAIAPGTFTDKIVLIGATAVGTYDLRSTPFSPRYAGLEVHAAVIDNILTQQFMTRPEWSSFYSLVAIIVLAGVVGVVVPRLSPLLGTLLFVVLFGAYIVAAVWFFVTAGAWLNMVYPLLSMLLTFTSLTVYHYASEQRERKRIKGTFRQYVAPLVVEEMLRDPSRLRLGGEEKVLTVLFSDLEGFTTYSEKFSPTEMTEILSEYYTRMTEQVFLSRGTLKEYIGDELMAFFGAPMEANDHAHRACQAALAMRDQRLALVSEWTQRGRPRLRARTGINSGPMLVGNLGSKYRFSYGVLGDAVNLGSRLEGLNKVYGTDILIGENTAQLVGDAFVLREVDMVRVKGREQTVHIYELIAQAATGVPPEYAQALTLYSEGLAAYRQAVWAEAIPVFQEALRVRPGDGPSQALLERCLAFQKAPPPEPWDAVFDQLTK